MENPYPSTDHYGPIKTLYGHPYPSTNRYGPANRFYGPLQDPSTRYVLPYISMADIRKQVNKG